MTKIVRVLIAISSFAISFSVGAAPAPGQSPASDTSPQSIAGWSTRIENALKEGKTEEALREMNQAVEAAPKQPQLYLMRGSLLFRSGKVNESIVDFDKCIELDPQSKPYLWQRGIALYYAGRYEEGRDQFVVHREVNPNDVENAFWHFLCAVRIEGVEKAQKKVLLSGFDSRVPLMQVQDLIQGKTTTQAIVDAVEKSDKGSNAKRLGRFYGYLYVGLYYDALGDDASAKQWIQKCVDENVDGYMGDVAKIHLQMLEARSKSKAK